MRFLVLFFTLLSLPASAAVVDIDRTGWVQISTSNTFSLQARCSGGAYIQSSPTQPPTTDQGDTSFRVIGRTVWNQSIDTGNPWWAMAANHSCRLIVEDF